MQKIDYAKVTAVPVEQPGKHKVDDKRINFKWSLTQEAFDEMKRQVEYVVQNPGYCSGYVYFGKFCVDMQFVSELDDYLTLLYYKLDPNATYSETSDGQRYDYLGDSLIMFKDFPKSYEAFKDKVIEIIKCDLEHRFDCTEADIYSDVPAW